MNISELSVRKPVTMTMVYVLVCVIAAVFVPRLGVALYPDATYPFVSVRTTYSNVGPEEIDKTVTDVIVNQLNRVPDLKSITSYTDNGQSTVRLGFDYNKNINEAVNDINSMLTRVLNALPDDCGTPSVMKFDQNAMPIMRLAILGDMGLDELRLVAENTVQPLIERVKGVASAEINGGLTTQIRVDVSNNRLEAYGLTLSGIMSALSARNVQLSNGTITQESVDYEIITDQYFKNLDDIRSTVISASGDSPAVVRLDDLATVYEAAPKNARRVYINGEPGLYIQVTNESGANPSSISKAIQALMPDLEAAIPKGVTVTIISDDTSMIDSTMSEVYSAALQGVLLTMLVIFLFLRNIKVSFIIGISIPISILITLMVMAMMELTINLMTMSGLILGMGMTVDSSIVIIENINKRRIWGEKSAIAAVLGSRNMIMAIMASTLTTICVFTPILIYGADLESYGQMFREVVITVVVSLMASLIVSVTLVPALCGSILRINSRTQKPLKNRILLAVDGAIARTITGMENGYARILRFCLRNRFLMLTLAFSLFALAIQQLGNMGMNLMPQSTVDDQVNITITLPIGTNTEVTRRYLFDFQEIIEREIPRDAYKTIVINTGSSNSGSIQINLPKLKDQTVGPEEVRRRLTPYLNEWSGVRVTFSAGRGPGANSNRVNVELISDDLDAASRVANDIVALLKTRMDGKLTDVDTDIENGSPRYEIHIDTDAAASAGVSVSAISTLLKTAITGSTATTFHTGGEDVNIVVALKDGSLTDPTDLGAIMVQTSGGLMRLDNFITWKESRSPMRIQREEGVRLNHVTGNLAGGITITEATEQVDALIKENIVLPDTVRIDFGGDARDIKKYNRVFFMIILLAVFLVFAVMAAQFESLVDPLIIFFSIPLLLIGVVGIYLLKNQSLSLYSLVGIVALVGIVVNNGIVLVDFTNQLVARKMPVFDACIESGRNRLQPILMTTITTVFCMVPIAFYPGEGAKQMQPLCLTIVGGLLSGAFMTLFVSPILYSLFNKRRERHFDDPESLPNQMIELDKMLKEGDIKIVED